MAKAKSIFVVNTTAGLQPSQRNTDGVEIFVMCDLSTGQSHTMYQAHLARLGKRNCRAKAWPVGVFLLATRQHQDYELEPRTVPVFPPTKAKKHRHLPSKW